MTVKETVMMALIGAPPGVVADPSVSKVTYLLLMFSVPQLEVLLYQTDRPHFQSQQCLTVYGHW